MTGPAAGRSFIVPPHGGNPAVARRPYGLTMSRSASNDGRSDQSRGSDGMPRNYLRACLLLILADGPAHGYELKQAVEGTFGDGWPPLNVGQIYTTFQRLERDGLVRGVRIAQEGRPDKRVYELTDAGRAALAAWLAEPAPGPQLKDEFFMKLILARLPGVDGRHDPVALIARQRRAYLQSLRDLSEMAARRENESNPTTLLLLEGAMLHLQADLKWLDLCEERLTDGGSEWTASS